MSGRDELFPDPLGSCEVCSTTIPQKELHRVDVPRHLPSQGLVNLELWVCGVRCSSRIDEALVDRVLARWLGARALEQRDEIVQLFLDADHWNRTHPGEPIEIDPDGKLAEILRRLNHLVGDPS